MPTPCRNRSASCLSFFPNSSAVISLAFCSEIPRTSASLSGSSSIILRLSSPNFFTILWAMAFPIPLTAPDAKYSSIPKMLFGSSRTYSSTKNCFPSVGWSFHLPLAFIFSETTIREKLPTQVHSSPSPSIVNTVYPLSSLRKTMWLIFPSSSSKVELEVIIIAG